MSVTVRPYRRGGWEVDIASVLPDGTHHREREAERPHRPSRPQRDGVRHENASSSCSTASPQADRRRCRHSTEFRSRFLDGYARANRQKPSGIAAKETILQVHLVPALGRQKLWTRSRPKTSSG